MKKIIKNIIKVLVAATLIVVPAEIAMAKDGTWSGSGTETDPYLIEDEADMKLLTTDLANTISDYSGKYITLTNDIVITENNWTPIGSKDFPFNGIFDGNNKKISGFKNSRTRYSGLFGYSSGTIKNLSVDGTTEGRYYAAILCGYNTGTMENVSASGTLTGKSYIGIVTGYNKGTVKNAISYGTVTAQSNFVGGTVGHNNSGTIEDSRNFAEVCGSGRAGGITGSNISEGLIKNCYNLGYIHSLKEDASYPDSDIAIGGITGYTYNNSNIYDCSNFGEVYSDTYCIVGGIVGYAYNARIQNCSNIGHIDSNGEYCGSIAGYGELNRFKSCYYIADPEYPAINGENDTYDATAADIAHQESTEDNGSQFEFLASASVKNAVVNVIVISHEDLKTYGFTYSPEKFKQKSNLLSSAVYPVRDISKDAVALYFLTDVEYYEPGEINFEENMNSLDTEIILKYICGLPLPENTYPTVTGKDGFMYSDLDKNNTVNLLDAIKSEQLIHG